MADMQSRSSRRSIQNDRRVDVGFRLIGMLVLLVNEAVCDRVRTPRSRRETDRRGLATMPVEDPPRGKTSPAGFSASSVQAAQLEKSCPPRRKNV